jgi:hypothetical protein
MGILSRAVFLTEPTFAPYPGAVMDLEAGVNPARSRHCNWLPVRRAIESQTWSWRQTIHRVANALGVNAMSGTTFVTDFVPSPIPVRELLPWLAFGVLLMLAIYFVGAEEGATSLIKGMYVHEFVHDGRHLLGFPCH